MDSETAYKLIREYRAAHYFVPDILWCDYEMKKRAAQQYAADEICRLLLEQPLGDPFEIIGDYAISYYFNALCANETQKELFNMSADAAEELWSYLADYVEKLERRKDK